MFKLSLIIFMIGLFGCTTLKKPFFYKATAGDGKISYILGTMHLGIPYNDLPSYVREEFENSKILFVESDITSEFIQAGYTKNSNMDLVHDLEQSIVYSLEKQKLISEHPATDKLNNLYLQAGYSAMYAVHSSVTELRPSSHFKAGESLRTRLSPKLWKFLVLELAPFFDERTIENLHIESITEILQVLRPTGVLISGAKAQRFDPRWSLDRNLIDKAHVLNKPIVSLEIPEELSPECLAEVSLYQIENNLTSRPEIDLKNLDELEFYYRQGDEKALSEYFEKNKNNFDSCLVVDRNSAWMPIIERNITERYVSQDEKFFIAVGVAHLVGQKNVLELLKRKGYGVERVKTE